MKTCTLYASMVALTLGAGPATADGDKLVKPRLLHHIDLSAFAEDSDYFRSTAQFGDLDNDGNHRDFIRYVNSNRMQAFAYDGRETVRLLWDYEADVELPRPSNRYFYKYVVWDIDRDNQSEVIGAFATEEGTMVMRILDGATGTVERTLPLPIDNPRHDDNKKSLRVKPVVADIRGLGYPQDIVLVEERDSRGDIYVFDDQLTTLWDTTGDHAEKKMIYAHYPWAYDLDGDGKDEIVGTWVLDDDGTRMYRLTPEDWAPEDFYYDHIDRGYAHDFLPDRPGMELLISHEYLHAMLLDGATGEVIWRKDGDHKDAKLTTVGEWYPNHEGIEFAALLPIDEDEKLTISLDRDGAEHNRTVRVEDGYPVDWDGDRSRDEMFGPQYGQLTQVATGEAIEIREIYRELAKDRHHEDMRLYMHALDMVGDYREELVAIDENELLIFGAEGEAPFDLPSPWEDPRYRLAIANQMSDNHPERSPWFDWRDIGIGPSALAAP